MKRVFPRPVCVRKLAASFCAPLQPDPAAASWIVVAVANGFAIPLPTLSDVGGKIALRLPRSLYKQMPLRAEAGGCSLNQLLVVAIPPALARCARMEE